MITSIEFDRLFGQVLTVLASIYFGRTALGGLLWLAASLPGRVGTVSRAASTRITPALVKRMLAVTLGTTGAAAIAGTGLAHAMDIDRTPITRVDASTPISATPGEPGFAPLIDRIPRSRASRLRPPLVDIAVRLDRAPCPDSYAGADRTTGKRASVNRDRGQS